MIIMKKIISMLIVFSLILSLVACGSGNTTKTLKMEDCLNKETNIFEFPGLPYGTDIDTAMKFFGSDVKNVDPKDDESNSNGVLVNYYEKRGKVTFGDKTADVAMMFFDGKLDSVRLIFQIGTETEFKQYNKELNDYRTKLLDDFSKLYGDTIMNGPSIYGWQKGSSQLMINTFEDNQDHYKELQLVFKSLENGPN